jgi:hypothetical protein
MFLPESQRPSFTPIQDHRQNELTLEKIFEWTRF